VGEVANATSLTEPGDPIIVDGAAGDVQIRPSSDVEAAYAEKARLRARRQEQYLKLRDVPSVTKDGVEITLSSMRASWWTCPTWPRPGRRASACSARNCSS
jgi:phosphotransferase system enzyme I (PtsP)